VARAGQPQAGGRAALSEMATGYHGIAQPVAPIPSHGTRRSVLDTNERLGYGSAWLRHSLSSARPPARPTTPSGFPTGCAALRQRSHRREIDAGFVDRLDLRHRCCC
jgi:hypothetical protein